MLVKLGEIHEISLKAVDVNERPIVGDTVVATIKDKSNNKFFNGLFWVDDQCELLIPHKGDGNYSLNFVPETLSLFEINIKSKLCIAYKNYVIQSFAGDESINGGATVTPIVKITSKTFLNQDGTNTTIVDSNNNPMLGVKITCYDSATKKAVAVAQSDINGDWEMIIKKGTYFFTFESDGYIAVSFERTVS